MTGYTPAYLAGLAQWTKEDWQAELDERAAIMEYDGGMSRMKAIYHALEHVKRLKELCAPYRRTP